MSLHTLGWSRFKLHCSVYGLSWGRLSSTGQSRNSTEAKGSQGFIWRIISARGLRSKKLQVLAHREESHAFRSCKWVYTSAAFNDDRQGDCDLHPPLEETEAVSRIATPGKIYAAEKLF